LEEERNNMLAGQIVAKGKVELVEIPEPDLGDVGENGEGNIIFQPDLACLCGSDMPFFKGEELEYPLEVGYSLHEMIGTVVDTNGRRFTRGNKVLAVPIRQRGFFERYSVSEGRTIPLDPRCPPPHALMAQPLGTVLFGLRKIPHLLGLNVAVVGQGPIGQLFCSALRNVGAREIIALDRIEERLKVSTVMGATTTINVDREDAIAVVARVTSDVMADVVIEAVGHGDQQLNFCADLCRHAGRVLYFGLPPETIDGVEWRKIIIKNLTIHNTLNPDFEIDFPLAMQWVAEGRVDVSPIITHRFPMRECQKAFEIYRDRCDGALKVLLEFPALSDCDR